MAPGAEAGAVVVEAALPDLVAQPGVHCETTTLRNLLSRAGVEISEPMLFGLGEGIDFEYHEVPGRPGPVFLTGRNGPSELIRNACTALGVDWEEEQPADADEATARVAELVGAGHAVGVTVDIFHLDYFASRAHFSAHCIAVVAVAPDTVTVVDTTQQGGLQTLPADSLRRARGSDEGYMPSPYRQFHVRPVPSDWSPRDLEARLPDLAWQALSRTMDRVLADRGPLLGPAGLRRCADEAPQWGTLLPRAEEQVAEFGRFWRYAGTGGTNFRGLFLEFLGELEERERTPDLALAVDDFEEIEQQWVELIDLMIEPPGDAGLTGRLTAVGERMHAIADAEERAFQRLQDMADTRVQGWR